MTFKSIVTVRALAGVIFTVLALVPNNLVPFDPRCLR